MAQKLREIRQFENRVADSKLTFRGATYMYIEKLIVYSDAELKYLSFDTKFVDMHQILFSQ